MPTFSRLGALTTLQAAQAGAANGTAMEVVEAVSVIAEISGTYTGITANWEGSIDGGTTWGLVQAMPLGTRTFSATATAVGLYFIPDAEGLTNVRARTTVSAPTGSMTVRARAALIH